jgi:hypothetical protein
VRDHAVVRSCFPTRSSGFDSLTPIIASLGPPLIYTIGSETQLLVNMLIFTPPLPWNYVIFAAGTSAGVYLGLSLSSICVFHVAHADAQRHPAGADCDQYVMCRSVGSASSSQLAGRSFRSCYHTRLFSPIRATHYLQRDLANLWGAAVSSQYADIARITLHPETVKAVIFAGRHRSAQPCAPRHDRGNGNAALQ